MFVGHIRPVCAFVLILNVYITKIRNRSNFGDELLPRGTFNIEILLLCSIFIEFYKRDSMEKGQGGHIHCTHRLELGIII